MNSSWHWTDEDEKRLNGDDEISGIEAINEHLDWLINKLRAAIQEINRMYHQYEGMFTKNGDTMGEEPPMLSVDEKQLCNRMKDAVKKSIRKMPIRWRTTELKQLNKAIDEAEV
jgi:hypothetical protein